MSANASCVFDEDGDSSDWIELYNSSNEAISLANYSLSDDSGVLNKWVFPSVSIAPQNYLLIFASGKNRIDLPELHTNFKISSSGESLYLSNSDGLLIDYLDPIHLGENDSYGRLPNGGENLIHLETPTPNISNNNTSQLVFSNAAGFYNESFKISIKSFLDDTIYYSLDGSIPTMNSTIFSDSILVYNKSYLNNYFSEFITTPEDFLLDYPGWESPGLEIDKANIIRCVSYENGIPSSEIYTQTYFVDEKIFEKYNLPVISLVTEEANLFNEETGIYVPGIHFEESNPNWTGNYFQKGILWEKPVHIEYFDETGERVFFQDAGIRIHGGKTRSAQQKSLRLYARNEYGKTHFNYSLLPKNETSEYKRFVLQSSMGCWDQSIIKDVISHNIVKDLNIETIDFQPTIVFLNGEYWGIHTIRDYVDQNYINYKYNTDQSAEILEGHLAAYEEFNNLFNAVEKMGISELDAYGYIEAHMDIPNYIDYQIAEMFLGNYDWPGNNVKFWRFEDANIKKWRWIFYDLDGGILDPEYNMFLHCTNTDPVLYEWPNPSESTLLFRKLLEYSTFKNQFIMRASEILNEYFSNNKMLNEIISVKNLYANSIEGNLERWNYPESYTDWEISVNNIIDFLTKRPCVFESQLIEFFNLSTFDFECEEVNESIIKLSPNPNTGNFSIENISENTIAGQLFLLNTNGKIVYQENFLSMHPYERHSLNLPHIAPGIYILKYIHNFDSENIKFIIFK